MVRARVLGWGFAGVVACSPGAFGQFAADRPQPNAGSGLQPASFAAAVADSAPHPWAVRPEHGGWFICVKSFTGSQSRQYAEELAQEIRTTHKAAAYLFEWGAEERQKEEQKRERIRQALAEREAPFLALRDQMRKKAEEEGHEFDATPPTVRVPKVEYQEQWAVLIGGFKDMDAASNALKAVRRWAAPEHKPHLLDQAAVAGPGQKQGEAAYINPFAAAMVVPNPTVRRADADKPAVDPGLKRWNEKEELSLLNCPKRYTLLVKTFAVPVRTQSKDSEPGVFEQLFKGSKAAEMLQATAAQAKELAVALRHPKMRPHPFESYVLHVKTGSLVTVGGFDSEDDPELHRLKRVLESMTFQMTEQGTQRPLGVQRMFDVVTVMPIPKTD